MQDTKLAETQIDSQGIQLATVRSIQSNRLHLDLPDGAQQAQMLGLTDAKIKVGDVVAYVLAGDQKDQIFVLGKLSDSALPALAQTGLALNAPGAAEAMVVAHPSKLALQCGAASITLYGDGRIRLNGTTITSTASTLNRVAGAQVKLN